MALYFERRINLKNTPAGAQSVVRSTFCPRKYTASHISDGTNRSACDVTIIKWTKICQKLATF